jgi:hypothetical protein
VNNLIIGASQQYENLTVFPVRYSVQEPCDYIPLEIAVKNGFVKISEINESGSVNNLLVINESEQNILLLDGEELIGAKQNRVMNTTILLPGNTKTQIPVSCVEQGRWSSRSKHFSTSDRIMPSKSKSRKMEDVTMNMMSYPHAKEYRADQGRVWHEVNKLIINQKVHSHTSAMSDVFEGSMNKIKNYIEHFVCEDGQNGMIVAINGELKGFEFISRKDVFSHYFPKLLRGFIMDALEKNVEKHVEIKVDNCREYVKNLESSNQSFFPSIGLGESFRYAGEQINAAALVYKEEVIHLSQLKKEAEDTEMFRQSDFIRR